MLDFFFFFDKIDINYLFVKGGMVFVKARWKRLISIIGVMTLVVCQNGMIVMAESMEDLDVISSESTKEEENEDTTENEVKDETDDTIVSTEESTVYEEGKSEDTKESEPQEETESTTENKAEVETEVITDNEEIEGTIQKY